MADIRPPILRRAGHPLTASWGHWFRAIGYITRFELNVPRGLLAANRTLSTRRICQSQHGVSGGRVAHEESGIGQHRPVVVERNRWPPAIRLNLVAAQPRERTLQRRLSRWRFDLLQRERNQARCVTIARGIERRI